MTARFALTAFACALLSCGAAHAQTKYYSRAVVSPRSASAPSTPPSTVSCRSWSTARYFPLDNQPTLLGSVSGSNVQQRLDKAAALCEAAKAKYCYVNLAEEDGRASAGPGPVHGGDMAPIAWSQSPHLAATGCS